MRLQSYFHRLTYYDRFILFLFIPFFLWSFLGGHKQPILGVNSDHIATLIAFFGSVLVFVRMRMLSSKFFVVLGLFGGVFLLFLISTLLSSHIFESLNIFVVNVVYLFITLALAQFFKDRLELFFNLIVWSTLTSSVIVLMSFYFLGLGSWLRVTIPVYEGGYFSYFPHGYESSSDPNVLSYFLFIGALVTLYVKGFSQYWWIVILLMVTAGLLTLSRSGFLGFLVAIFVVVSVKFLFLFYGKKLKIKSFITFLFTFLFLSVVVFSLVMYEPFFEVVGGRISSEGSNESRIFRLAYSYGFLINSDVYNLLFGHGLGFTRIDLDPHNFWISVLVDTGLLSFFLTLFVFSFLFYKSYVVAEASNLKLLLLSLFLFFLVVSLLYWQLRIFYFVILVFIVVYLGSKQTFKV